ncbi:MAG: ABC transporter permease [Armatimonadota bacterium]|nr:ABC transporter permease [Armatimonadota bacterium]MDR7453861.1 ABC transporter permease [Armatimonadota bacterium]MDR7495694.1 ABC transporter permease [Armatimonadota bacterium]MDR7511060.1 ABC transporter permease [Armatimonadota bacterium]
MTLYVARRLVSLGFVLLGMSVLTFTLSRVIPADPAAAAAGFHATAEQVAQYRREMGLDQPLHAQYLRYMTGIVLHGDLGRSILNQRPVVEDIATFLPASLELAMVSLILCVPLGIGLGTYTAVRAGRFSDAATRGFAVLGVSMPIFIVALLLQLVFYKALRWFPSGGRLGSEFAPPEAITGFLLVDTLLRGSWPMFVSAAHHIALPAATLAVANLAVITRMTRSSLLEVLSADYVRTARAKGLSESRVLRHALKNSLIPVVTVIGLQFASMIAYVFLVEHIFSWPGIGSYAVRAIVGLDFQPIMAITLLFSVIYVAVNFAVDLSYLALDPRIRY